MAVGVMQIVGRLSSTSSPLIFGSRSYTCFQSASLYFSKLFTMLKSSFCAVIGGVNPRRNVFVPPPLPVFIVLAPQWRMDLNPMFLISHNDRLPWPWEINGDFQRLGESGAEQRSGPLFFLLVELSAALIYCLHRWTALFVLDCEG